MNQEFSGMVMDFARILSSKQADDIVCINVSGLTIVADYFLIATGRSSVHVKSLADDLEETLAKQGILPIRKEGYSEGRWIVLDFGDILVHIFHKDEREFYNIERLWTDGNNIMNYSDEDKE
ncbi:MAG: ribosome silencing factor [Eubacteriales bacterium]